MTRNDRHVAVLVDCFIRFTGLVNEVEDATLSKAYQELLNLQQGASFVTDVEASALNGFLDVIVNEIDERAGLNAEAEEAA